MLRRLIIYSSLFFLFIQPSLAASGIGSGGLGKTNAIVMDEDGDPKVQATRIIFANGSVAQLGSHAHITTMPSNALTATYLKLDCSNDPLTANLEIAHTGDAAIILNRTTHKACALGAGTDGGIFQFDEAGYWGIQSEDKATILSGTLTGDVRLYIDGASGDMGIGTIDLDGTPAKGRLVVKGTTADGSTNVFVARDSAEANVLTIDTDGDLTTTGTGTFGQIIDSGLTASLGVYTDGSKQLTSTPPSSGILGYWSRTGTTLSQATANDALSLGSGTITTTGTIGSGTHTIGGTTGVALSAATGKLTLTGVGNTNNEDIAFDCELTSNRVTITTSTGATAFWNMDCGIAGAKIFEFGTGGGGKAQSEGLRHSTTGNDCLQLGLRLNNASYSGVFVICEFDDLGNANRSPSTVVTNPTLRIYSSDDTEALDYLEFYHNQTDSVIDFGNGNLRIGTADSKKMVFGAAQDATISFDGDSLNIVANAVTSTDALEMTAGSGLFTLGGGSAIRMLGLGTRNLFLGNLAGNTGASGQVDNVGIGAYTLDAVTSGDDNVGVGNYALSGVSTGLRNVGIGSAALYTQSTNSYNVAIGYYAGYSNASSQNVFIGDVAGYGNVGGFNTFVGGAVGYNNNVANVANYSCLYGYNAGYAITNADYTVAMGYQSAYNITGGDFNTALGAYAGYSLGTAASNSLLGYAAGYATTGDYNVLLGREAGRLTTSIANSVFIGYYAGYGVANQSTGDNNTAIGGSALQSFTTAANNVAVGYASGGLLSSGGSNIFLGNYAGYRQSTNSNLLIIDNQQRASAAEEATNAILYGVMAAAPANQTLDINAATRLNGTARIGSATGVQLSAAAGVLTIAGIGNTNNENLTINFEVLNEVQFGTGTGVTDLKFNDLKYYYYGGISPTTDVTNSYYYPVHIQHKNASNGAAAGISFGVSSTDQTLGASIYHVREGAGSYGYLSFLTKNAAGSAAERMRLTNGGNLWLVADSQQIVLGAASDASITFDGNSLNIVANAVTGTDALEFTAGSYKFQVPADTDIALNFTGTTNSGVLTWMEDEDYFKFSDDIFLGTENLYFNGTDTGLSESSDDILVTTPANKTLVLSQPVYKDINIAGALLSKPASSAPGTDTFRTSTPTDTGIETYAFAEDEKVHGGFELQHDYKEGTDLVFHVHFQIIAAPTGTDNVQWRIAYIVARDGVTLTTVTTIDSPDTAVDTQYRMYRTDFGAITGTNFKIGDQFMFTLTRVSATGDAFAGDCLIETAGIHYQSDTMGSRQIGTK